MTKQTIKQNKGLLNAFKRYLSMDKTNIRKLLPEIVYRTMRLEGEKVSRKQAQALFR